MLVRVFYEILRKLMEHHHAKFVLCSQVLIFGSLIPLIVVLVYLIFAFCLLQSCVCFNGIITRGQKFGILNSAHEKSAVSSSSVHVTPQKILT